MYICIQIYMYICIQITRARVHARAYDAYIIHTYIHIIFIWWTIIKHPE